MSDEPVSDTGDPRRLISLRVPSDVLDAVESSAAETGRTRTAVIVDALEEMYGGPELDPLVDCA